MRSRLGQYTAVTQYGEPAEITISRRHIKRHGWSEALHTLLHEMVHQWQAEYGAPDRSRSDVSREGRGRGHRTAGAARASYHGARRARRHAAASSGLHAARQS